MKRTYFISIFFLLLTFPSVCQRNDTLLPIELAIVSRVNQGNSYITFPTDIGNIEPLWFEGNLIPNFNIRRNKSSRLMAVLTPQIILRMYQEKSNPVRTPSYIPQITVYYDYKEKSKTNNYSIYGRFAHHSNGQEGTFYLNNGEINHQSGDFSTNFFELGFVTTKVNTRFNAYQFFKTSIEIHPDDMIQDELQGQYSQYRWHSAFSIFKLSQKDDKTASIKPVFSIKGETIWMFGDYNNLGAFSTDRFTLSLTFYYHPTFLEEIGLFMQYYHGTDYYNLYFDHRLDVLRLGIMTETLTF